MGRFIKSKVHEKQKSYLAECLDLFAEMIGFVFLISVKFSML